MPASLPPHKKYTTPHHFMMADNTHNPNDKYLFLSRTPTSQKGHKIPYAISCQQIMKLKRNKNPIKHLKFLYRKLTHHPISVLMAGPAVASYSKPNL